MYVSNLRRAGTATRPGHSRRVRPLGLRRTRTPPASQQRASGAARHASTEGVVAAPAESSVAGWRVPSASSLAGIVALVPVLGGAWLVTIYALRERLCENHLQQVAGVDSLASRDKDRRRRSRNANSGEGGKGRRDKATIRQTQPPLYPGSSADARALRELLARPASGVTVLCVDPPASYTGDAFVGSALLGRAATVHVRAGEGYGSLAACLARGLGVEFMAIKLQISALLPGLGGERDTSSWRGRVAGLPSSTSIRELSDIRAVLETATAALEEIRNQAADPRNHLPPVIVIDGLLGRIRAEDVPADVEAVLRWCWTITGGRRLAHVVLIAPQSMAVDGSLVRAKDFLNDGRLAPGMMRVIALNAPDSSVTERRFRSRFSAPQRRTPQEADEEGERAVTLCMELVHREGCAVAEEANEILRRTEFLDDSPTSVSASRRALEETLEGFALEAWRRVAAAVASTTAPSPPDAASGAGGAGGAVAGRGFFDAVAHAAGEVVNESTAAVSISRPPPPSTAIATAMPVVVDNGAGSGVTLAKANAQFRGGEVGVTGVGALPRGGDGGGDGDGGNYPAVGEGGRGGGRLSAMMPSTDAVAVVEAASDGFKGDPDVINSISSVALGDGQAGERDEEFSDNTAKEAAVPADLDQSVHQPLERLGFLADSDDSAEAKAAESSPKDVGYPEEAERFSAPGGGRRRLFSSNPSSFFSPAVKHGEAAENAVPTPEPATPLGRLVGLLGELADGGKVTLQHAVETLDGDGPALARLLDLGVVRLCPQTVSSSLGDASAAAGRSPPLSLSLSLSLPSSPLEAGQSQPRKAPSPEILAEAGAAFQVVAATPLMAGVFSILKGCHGVEEQAIARAIHFLRRGRSIQSPAESAFEAAPYNAEHEMWQAHREASMAVLVHRAMATSASMPGQGRGSVRSSAEAAEAAVEGGRWRGRRGDRRGVRRSSSASEYRSRRLQTALAAVGCMTTWSEVYKELSAADTKGGILADETFLPGLLRTYRHALSPPPVTENAMAGGAVGPILGESSGRSEASDYEEETAIVADSIIEQARISSADDDLCANEVDGGSDSTAAAVTHAGATGNGSGGATKTNVVPGSPYGESRAANGERSGVRSDEAQEGGGQDDEASLEGVFANQGEGVVYVESGSSSSSSSSSCLSGDGKEEKAEVSQNCHQREEDLGRDCQDGEETEGNEGVDGDALFTELRQQQGELRDDSPISPTKAEQEESSSSRADEAGRGGSASTSSGPVCEEDLAGESTKARIEQAAAASKAAIYTPPSSDIPETASEPQQPPSEGNPFDEGVLRADSDVNGYSCSGDGDGDGDGKPTSSPTPNETRGHAGQADRFPKKPPGPAGSGAAPTGEDSDDGEHEDETLRGSSAAGGDPEEEANVDVTASARENHEINNFKPLVTAEEKTLEHRSAPWGWMMRAWSGAGGKHH